MSIRLLSDIEKQYSQENKDNISTVRTKLEPIDVLLQLAEEAAELSQAASKQVRILRGLNPTPVTYEESRKNLSEEFADVLVCMNTLSDDLDVSDVYHDKLKRWADRVENGIHKD